MNFEHSSSSPYHQQSNGLAEKYGNIAKNLLDKAKADEKDPYISLLDYRNTPINDVSSPAQLLMNRRLKGKLPATQKQLIPKVTNIREKMKINKMKQKNYYDRHAKDQPQFRKGQTVRYLANSRWKPAVITNQHDQPRSYTFQTPYGNKYRRNANHLTRTNENFENISLDNEIAFEHSNGDTNINKENQSNNSEKLYTTRSGRTVRPPIRYKDC